MPLAGLRSGLTSAAAAGLGFPTRSWGSFLRSPVLTTDDWRLAAGLSQPAQLLHRPVTEDGLAVDVVLFHRAEVTAVVRHAAMVAQHEVAVRRHDDFRVGALVGINRWHVVFLNELAIDVDLPGVNADLVSGHADHALDVALGGVAR